MQRKPYRFSDEILSHKIHVSSIFVNNEMCAIDLKEQYLIPMKGTIRSELRFYSRNELIEFIYWKELANAMSKIDQIKWIQVGDFLPPSNPPWFSSFLAVQERRTIATNSPRRLFENWIIDYTVIYIAIAINRQCSAACSEGMMVSCNINKVIKFVLVMRIFTS